MDENTHYVPDKMTAEYRIDFTPTCEFSKKPPHEWPPGHDLTWHLANATCLYCKSGQKHPEAVS